MSKKFINAFPKCNMWNVPSLLEKNKYMSTEDTLQLKKNIA